MVQNTRLGSTLVEGMKTPVVVATTLNITLQGLPLISGVQLAANDRVLVKTQNNKAENGIYVVAAGTWDRAKDFNASNDVVNGQVVVDSNSGLMYRIDFTGAFDLGVTLTNFFVVQSFNSKDRDNISDMLNDSSLSLTNVVHVKEETLGAGSEVLIFDVRTFITEDTPNGIYTGIANTNLSFVRRKLGVIFDEAIDRLNPATLAAWQNDTSAQAGDLVTTKERSTGNGGGATGDVIAGTGTANGSSIVAHGTLSLSFVLRQDGNIVDVAAYGWSNTVDSFAAINQATLDLVDGGILFFNPIMRALITGSQRVTISADDVTIEGIGAELQSEFSDNPESTVQNAVFPGVIITGNRCTLKGLVWRGGLFFPQGKVFHAFGFGKQCYNLHNAAFALSNLVEYEYVYIGNYGFDTSLDSDAGNFTAIQRAGASTDPRAQTIIVDNCKFKGVSGGVNMHNCDNVYIYNALSEGVDINHFKVDEGTKNLVVTGVFDGAAVNSGSANRHLNSDSSFCGFITGVASPAIESVTLDLEMKNFTVTKGVDFVDSSSLYKTVAKIKATDCTVPVWSGCPGTMDLDLDVKDCGADAVEISSEVGVSALSQRITGRMIDSQLVIGNSASNSRDSELDVSVDVSYTATDAIKAVDLSPSVGFELDFARIHDCNVTTTTGVPISGTAGNFDIVIAKTTVTSGTAPNTGIFEGEYPDSTLTGTIPVIKRGELKLRNLNGGVTSLSLAEASAVVGDEISVLNDGGNVVNMTPAGGSTNKVDGQNTLQIPIGASVTITKFADATNEWRTISEFGAVTRF